MRRLRASADRIALPLPTSDAEIRERITTTIAAAQLPAEAYIRLLVTRGVGEIGYDPAIARRRPSWSSSSRTSSCRARPTPTA